MRCIDDPRIFFREILGVEPEPYQDEIALAVRSSEYTAAHTGHGVGKCLALGETVMLSDGQLCTAGDLIGQTVSLPVWDELNNRVQYAPAHIFDNGAQDVYELTTKEGRTLQRTGNHPLWAKQIATAGTMRNVRARLNAATGRWVGVAGLGDGFAVAVPDTLSTCPTTYDLGDDEVKVLAYLIGDGNTTTHQVRFTQQDNAQLSEFREVCANLGDSVKYISRYDYRVVGGNVATIVRSHQLLGKSALQKSVPRRIFTAPDRVVALFLSRLFATDGWVTTSAAMAPHTPRIEIGYATSSPTLARDVTWLLYRLGITSSIDTRVPHINYPTTNVRCQITIHNARGVVDFADKIGIYGKEQVLARVVTEARRRLTSSKLPTWQYENVPSGFHWERVKSVKVLGLQPTAGIEVPQYHTFITHFLEHNTTLGSWLLLWFLFCHFDSKVITTAPTWRQVKDLLWSEVHKWARRMDLSKMGWLWPYQLLDTRLEITEEWFATGEATDNPEKLEGYHAPSILYLIDEAKGVPDSHFNSMDGGMTTPFSRMVLLSTPGDTKGKLWRVCTGKEDKEREDDDPGRWQIFHVDGEKSLRVSKKWVEGRAKAWGRNSALFKIRVNGIFVDSTSDTLIPAAWFDAACERELTPDRKDPRVMSVDVARYGVDSTVVGLRDGMKVHPFRKYERQSLEKTADIVYDTVVSEQPDLIIVDESGIGAGVLDNLLSARRPATRNRVVGFNGSRKPDKEEEFYNRRAEVYWYLREQFQKNLIDIPDDEALGPQLTEMGYQYKSLRGHTVMIIESKEEARRAGKPSPDEADALAMLFADEVSNQPGYGVWV